MCTAHAPFFGSPQRESNSKKEKKEKDDIKEEKEHQRGKKRPT